MAPSHSTRFQLANKYACLLNRYRMDFLYYRGMVKNLRDEALHALDLHREQRLKMMAHGYKLDRIDLHLGGPESSATVPSDEKMDVES